MPKKIVSVAREFDPGGSEKQCYIDMSTGEIVWLNQETDCTDPSLFSIILTK